MTGVDHQNVVEQPGFYPPGPHTRDPSLFQAIRHTLRSSIEAWPRAVYEERFYQPPIPGTPILLMDPELVRAVLVDQAEIFPQGGLFQRMLRPVWGRGLAVAEGAEWRWQRRAAAPSFRPAGLTAFVPRMRVAAEQAMDRWNASSERSLDMVEEAAAMTFDVILDTILSGGEDFDRGQARDQISAFLAQIDPLRLSYFLAPDAYHRRRRPRRSAEADRLRATVDRMIARRRTGPPRGDLVDMLMAATDPETGRAMDDDSLRDNLLGFIVAGHGTTALGLAWSLYLVSQHAPTAERLRREVEEVTDGGPIGPKHLGQLIFTRQVVSEALRLYPPAHSTTRICTRTIQIGDIKIRKGKRVIIPIYAMHRHRGWWRDPDLFDPDRFAPGKLPPDRHLYMPFGAGPRICIGAALATMEMVVMLGTVVRSTNFQLVPGHDVWPVATLGLAPRGGMPMTIVGRYRGVQEAAG